MATVRLINKLKVFFFLIFFYYQNKILIGFFGVDRDWISNVLFDNKIFY